jgi:alanyl aminopeptidase
VLSPIQDPFMTNYRFPLALACLFAAFSLLAACSESPTPATEVALSPGPAPVGQLGTSIVPNHYRLELRIDPREERFAGTTSIDLTVSDAASGIWLHGKDLEVSEVYVVDRELNRINASYEQHLDSGVALVSLESPVASGEATLNLVYTAAFNTSTNALFKVLRGEDAYAATQFEPIAARQVFPGFDDPGFKVPFDLSLVTQADDVAITNTPEAASEDLTDGFVRHTFETTRPMPTYLLAFAVGPYDVVDYGMIPPNSIRDRGVRLRGIVAKGLGHRAEYALQHTDGLLTVLEEYFGTPYPYRKLDLIAMPESFGGAMENIGAITYDEYLLLMDEDSPLDQRRAYAAVHAHEMAHMWFGNLVTPGWWNDIWLNESFASWMMYKVADAYWPEGEFDRETLKGALGAMNNDSLAAAREIREPIDHSDKIGSAFDGITYQKGGGVLTMLERYVGEDLFRDGVQLHMGRHSDSTATAEDFIASVAEGSDRTEIEAAFKSYIGQAGVPLLSVSLDCSVEDKPVLNVSQSRYAPLGSTIDSANGQWHVPMCVSFRADGEDKSNCTLLNEKTQSISLEASSCPTRVHPNADGAGYYRFAMDDEGWQQLIEGAAELPASEALGLGDSLDAAFRAGEVTAERYVAGMAALLQHDAWDVVDGVTGYFEAITDVIESDKLEPLEAAFRALIRPVFADLGDATDSGSLLLRQRLLRFLIVMAKDEDMRAPLAEQAAARIGLDGEPDPAAAPASELETILSIGVQDTGEPFFDLLLEQATASEDPAFRDSAAGALARVEDPALVARLQAAVLDGRFKGTEALGIMNRQMVRSATTELTYAWVRKNDAAIIEMIPQSFRSSVVPSMGNWFCSADRADEWQAFVESHADELPGYERDLAQATESVRLCAALRNASQDDLIEAFGRYGSSPSLASQLTVGDRANN